MLSRCFHVESCQQSAELWVAFVKFPFQWDLHSAIAKNNWSSDKYMSLDRWSQQAYFCFLNPISCSSGASCSPDWWMSVFLIYRWDTHNIGVFTGTANLHTGRVNYPLCDRQSLRYYTRTTNIALMAAIIVIYYNKEANNRIAASKALNILAPPVLGCWIASVQIYGKPLEWYRQQLCDFSSAKRVWVKVNHTHLRGAARVAKVPWVTTICLGILIPLIMKRLNLSFAGARSSEE